MTECTHERTVQIMGAVFKCSNCSALITDADIPPPDWEHYARIRAAREARKRAAIRRNRLHRPGGRVD